MPRRSQTSVAGPSIPQGHQSPAPLVRSVSNDPNMAVVQQNTLFNSQPPNLMSPSPNFYPPASPQSPQPQYQALSQKIDKVFSTFSRSLSLMSIRSSLRGLGSKFGSGSNISLSGPRNPDYPELIGQDENFLRCHSTLSPAAINFRIKHVENKLQIEKKLEAGTDRMFQVLTETSKQASAGSSSLAAPISSERTKRIRVVMEKLNDCKDKVRILNQSLKGYRLMVVGEKDLPSLPDEFDEEPFPKVNLSATLTRVTAITSTPNAAKSLISGHLKITLVGATSLPRSLVGDTGNIARSETFAIIKVDGVEKSRTRGSRGKWMDLADIQLDKAREVEISVHEKQGGSLLGFVWFQLQDLSAMVKNSQARRLTNASYLVRSDSFVRENAPDDTPNPVTASSAVDLTVSGVSQGETCWLDLEGGGQICLKLDISVDTPTKKLNKSAELNVGREKPVQKVWMVQGHKFVNVRFYFVVKCAVCRDFLVASQGYQCQVCKYVCHKDCQSRVPAKCLSSESTPTPDRAQTLLSPNHSPHRFANVPPAEAVTVAWCAHCGYMLSLLNRESRRCAECGVCAHSGCSVLVPDVCGMDFKELNSVVPIEKGREPKKSKEPAGASIMSVSASRMHEVSTLAGSKVGEREKPKKSKPRPVGLDDFVFLAVLGKGNFGKVMLAEEKVTGNLFAIKVLKKEFIIASDEVEATRAEKRVFLTVQRFPFLVGLHSCFQTESRLYFVMEFVGGGDLMWHIQQSLFGEERAKFYAIEVLLAIEHLHKANIAYRDLKLDNILLTREGHVKVADYGLCKEGMRYGSTTVTFCGTPEFMSPEILQEKPYTRSVDWWSFGVLVYELLYGQAPFKGSDEDEIFESILQTEPHFSSRSNPLAVDLIKKLLKKDPKERLGSGDADSEEVKSHPYFEGVKWDDYLALKIAPPFVPANSSKADVSNFDEEFTKEQPVLTPCKGVLAAAEQEEFRGFTHVSDWAMVSRQASLSQKT
ncbi:Serine/threonine kinase [Entophlyctis luteolus]|nr:Serine/threonine kinase [Entophlyctis luteolus]